MCQEIRGGEQARDQEEKEPAKAGIQRLQRILDPGFHRGDGLCWCLCPWQEAKGV